MWRLGSSGPEAAFVASVTIDFGNCLANATVSASVTVKGARVGDVIYWTPADGYTTLNAGLVPGPAVVTADDTVTFNLANVTVGALNAALVTFKVLVIKATNIGAG